MRKDGSSLRILVVDDEPLICDMLCRFLDKNSSVMAVGSAEEALEEIRAQHCDLCFLDVTLPGMNGVEAMKIIKELSPSTKVAIMSGGHLCEDMKRQIAEGALEFIEKPFDLSRIREIANRVAAAVTGKST
ncbi:MAG: response regulator [Desulfobulbaceae bacterium]|nr:response regulator [Desulfobulbaceae bacterium]